MLHARVIGFGLLLGPWAGCSSDEAPARSSPSPSTSTDAPPASSVDEPTPSDVVVTAPPVGAWVRVSQMQLLTAANQDAKLDVEAEQESRLAEVVRVEGEFVELRTIALKPVELCGASGADPSFELHFYARLEALERVPKIGELDDACARFTQRDEGEVPAGRNFDPDHARTIGEPRFTEKRCAPTWDAPAGVAVTWYEAEGVAGSTRTAVRLPKHASEENGKVCFIAGEIPVCMASELLTRSEDPSCMPAPELDFPSKVRQLVEAHDEEIRRCYDASLKKHPGLAGYVSIAFEIDQPGKVSHSRVFESSLTPMDEALPQCLAKALQRWKFPDLIHSGSASLVHSFVFPLQ